MGNSSSKRKITSRDKAILDLKVQRDRLKQYQKKVLIPFCFLKSISVQIFIVLEREVEIAKEHIRNGHKDRAMLALKKKKYQEQLLEKTNGQLLNLEQLVNPQSRLSFQCKIDVIN
jgi:charged multivesicular body protein 6